MNFQQPVTYSIISINVITYLLLAWATGDWSLSSNESSLAITTAGANLNHLTLGGQPWRILTAAFLHYGILHLAVNMYALYALGSFLEPAIGHLRFLLIYLICALTASIASLLFNEFIPSAGASGAIFGLYGYQLGAQLIASYRDKTQLKAVLLNFGIFVVINAFIAGQVSVDMAGHIGGALAGVLIAVFHFKLHILKRVIALVAVMILLPFTIFLLPKDQVAYADLFKKATQMDRRTNGLFDQVNDDMALIDSLRDIQRGWDNVRRGVTALKRVPATVAEDTSRLRNYATLRSIQTGYRLRLANESYIYMDSMEVVAEKLRTAPRLQKFIITGDNIDIDEPEPVDSATRSQSRLQPVREFYDKDWKVIHDPTLAVYYRIGTKDSLGRWQGSVRDFYINGDVQMKGSYQNSLRHGVFIYYSDHKTYTSAGRYDRDRAVGKWEEFHWNGKLKSETFYGPVLYTKTVNDSLGNAQVTEGTGTYRSWHKNGAVEEEGVYVNGARSGDWIGYHEDGKPFFKETYDKGRLIAGVSIGRNGEKYYYDETSLWPFPPDGHEKYREYIKKNLRPCGASGVVKLSFTVGRDGSLWDFVVLEGLGKECNAEAIRVIASGRTWRPALDHGAVKVISQGYYEVQFADPQF